MIRPIHAILLLSSVALLIGAGQAYRKGLIADDLRASMEAEAFAMMIDRGVAEQARSAGDKALAAQMEYVVSSNAVRFETHRKMAGFGEKNGGTRAAVDAAMRLQSLYSSAAMHARAAGDKEMARHFQEAAMAAASQQDRLGMALKGK